MHQWSKMCAGSSGQVSGVRCRGSGGGGGGISIARLGREELRVRGTRVLGEEMNLRPETSVSGRGPIDRPDIVGIDEAPERRPGVPMEAEPPRPSPGAYWHTPERQRKRFGHLKRKGLDELTPVFGNTIPPRGASGIMRRIAYRIPEHRARHWTLLLMADRVDVLEGRLGRRLARPFEGTRLERIGRLVERNPVAAMALTMGTAAILWRVVRR